MNLFSIAVLVTAVNAAANAEANPQPCLWLKKKLGLCGGGSGGSWGGNSQGSSGGRATMIVYTTVYPAEQTTTVTIPGSTIYTTSTVNVPFSCNAGDYAPNGAYCGNDNQYTIVKTAHHTNYVTVTQDVVSTCPGPVETQHKTEWVKEWCTVCG